MFSSEHVSGAERSMRNIIAVKPATVQKNTGRTNTEGTRIQSAFHSRRPELRYNYIFRNCFVCFFVHLL